MDDRPEPRAVTFVVLLRRAKRKLDLSHTSTRLRLGPGVASGEPRQGVNQMLKANVSREA